MMSTFLTAQCITFPIRLKNHSYHSLFDVETFHRAFHSLVRVRSFVLDDTFTTRLRLHLSKKRVVYTTATQKCDESEEISTRLTFFSSE